VHFCCGQRDLLLVKQLVKAFIGGKRILYRHADSSSLAGLVHAMLPPSSLSIPERACILDLGYI
jgi:hypothetical protein